MIDLDNLPNSNLHRTIALTAMVTVLEALLVTAVEEDMTTTAQMMGSIYNMIEKLEGLRDE